MNVPSQRLPRSERLRASRDFRAVSREGRRATAPHLQVLARPNGLTRTRFGISCHREGFRRATERNRMRRRLRELVRLTKAEVASGWDVVLMAKRDGQVTWEILKQEWLMLVHDLALMR